MELENTDQVLDNEVSTEADELTGLDTLPEATEESAEVETPAEPVWEPDFKYKVYDEEREMDDWARKIIKTPEDLEKFKKFYEAEGGFSVLKERHNQLKSEIETKYTPIEKSYSEQSKIVGDMLTYLDKKDYRSFFKQLDVAEDDVLKYALDIVKYREMSPDQRQAVDQQYSMQEQNLHLERQTNQFQTQLQEQAMQTRSLMLNQELSKPDVLSFVSDFENAYGKPGSFKEEVIKEGQLMWATQGVDLTPEQAVQNVIGKYRAFIKPAPQQPTNNVPQVVQPKAVLPNVQASGTSPAKRQVNSLADIRALAHSME